MPEASLGGAVFAEGEEPTDRGGVAILSWHDPRLRWWNWYCLCGRCFHDFVSCMIYPSRPPGCHRCGAGPDMLTVELA